MGVTIVLHHTLGILYRILAECSMMTCILMYQSVSGNPTNEMMSLRKMTLNWLKTLNYESFKMFVLAHLV